MKSIHAFFVFAFVGVFVAFLYVMDKYKKATSNMTTIPGANEPSLAGGGLGGLNTYPTSGYTVDPVTGEYVINFSPMGVKTPVAGPGVPQQLAENVPITYQPLSGAPNNSPASTVDIRLRPISASEGWNLSDLNNLSPQDIKNIIDSSPAPIPG